MPINLQRSLEPGTKKLKILSVDEKFGPSGYPYLTFQIEVIRGEDKGMVFSDMLSLSPNARFRMNAFLDAIGAPAKGSVENSYFVNKKAWGNVTLDTSRDRPQYRVEEWLLPPENEEEDPEEELEEIPAGLQAAIQELVPDDTDPFNS